MNQCPKCKTKEYGITLMRKFTDGKDFMFRHENILVDYNEGIRKKKIRGMCNKGDCNQNFWYFPHTHEIIVDNTKRKLFKLHKP